jgi:hypothetical protein
MEVKTAEDDCSESLHSGGYYAQTAQYSAAVKVIYFSYLLTSVGFPPTGYMPVYEDNTTCIKWSNNIIRGQECAKLLQITWT